MLVGMQTLTDFEGLKLNAKRWNRKARICDGEIGCANTKVEYIHLFTILPFARLINHFANLFSRCLCVIDQ